MLHDATVSKEEYAHAMLRRELGALGAKYGNANVWVGARLRLVCLFSYL
jgi:hypothetical protein